MEVSIVTAERGGKVEVLLQCKASEKVIPPSVVRHSDLLKAIKFERKKVTCQFPWVAACNWAAWDPWEDPGWPASDLCGALQVAEFLQDGEIQTRAELISERLQTHMQAPAKPKSRLGKLMTSIKSRMRSGRPGASVNDKHAAANASDSAPVSIDSVEDLLSAVEQLPTHLLQLVLKPFSFVSVLRLLTDEQHPKLVMALQPRMNSHRSHQQLTQSSTVTDMPSMTNTSFAGPSSPRIAPERSGMSTEPDRTPDTFSNAASRSRLSAPKSNKSDSSVRSVNQGKVVEQGESELPEVHALTLSYIGSTAAQLMVPQLASLHAHLTADNPPFAPPVRLINLDLSNNNLGAPSDASITHRPTPPPQSEHSVSGGGGSGGSRSRRNSRSFSGTALDVLAAHITALTALQTLNLSFNSLSQPEALSALVASLWPLQWLQALDLSHNLIDSDAAAATAPALAVVSGLTHLNLSSNYIGCKGAKAITEALFISKNAGKIPVDTQAANASTRRSASIAGGAEDPGEGETLDVSGTLPRPVATGGAGNEKSEFVRNTAMVASPLEILDLSHNDLEPPGLLAVAGAFSHAHSCAYHLRQLHLSHNCRSHERASSHNVALASSKSLDTSQPSVVSADGSTVHVNMLPGAQKPSKMRSKWMRVPTGDESAAAISLPSKADAWDSADACVESMQAQNCVDMLEALTAMAPSLVASNLPRLQVLDAGEFAAIAVATGGDLSIMADELEGQGGLTFARRDVFGFKNGTNSPNSKSPEHNGDAGSHSGAGRNGATHGITSEVTALAYVPVKEVMAKRNTAGRVSTNVSTGDLGEDERKAHRRARSRRAGLVTLGRSFATFAGTLLSLDIRGVPVFASSPAAAGAFAGCLGALTALTSLNLSATSLGEGMRVHAKARRHALAALECGPVVVGVAHAAANAGDGPEVAGCTAAETGRDGGGGGLAEGAGGRTRGARVATGVCEALEGAGGDGAGLVEAPDAARAPALETIVNAACMGGPEGDQEEYDSPVQSLCGAKKAVNCAPSAGTPPAVQPPASPGAAAAAAAAVAAAVAAAEASPPADGADGPDVGSARSAPGSNANGQLEASVMPVRHACNHVDSSSELSHHDEDFVPDAELLGADSSNACLPAEGLQPSGSLQAPNPEDALMHDAHGDSLRGVTAAKLPSPTTPTARNGTIRNVPNGSKKREEEFSADDLKAAAASNFTAFLGKLQCLQHLDLSFNSLGTLRTEVTHADAPPVVGSDSGQDAACCSDVATGVLPVLQVLGGHIGAVQPLKELNLGGNGLANGLMPIVEEALPKLRCLQCLDLANNRISGTVFNQAADHIAAAGCLTRLSVNANLIGSLSSHSTHLESGVGALAVCIEQLPALQCLEANSNGIAHEEGELLLAAVGKAAFMRVLHLRQQDKLDLGAAKEHLSQLEEWVM